MKPMTPFPRRMDGEAYQARFDALAASGMAMHGEADFVSALGPRTVLDAGCGTGRVAIELARRGLVVTGVEVDPSMLAVARARAPRVEWIEADLCELSLGRTFDAVVLAGNVPLFCPPDGRSALVHACAHHVAPEGALVAGFRLDGDYTLDEWDDACRDAGLALVERFSTWARDPFDGDASYTVSLHRVGEREAG